jgi:preprotein translocase SecE subunit
MASNKKIVKWGAIILAALIYLAICAVPFLQYNPTVASVNSANASSKNFQIRPIWTMNDKVILTLGEVIVLGVLVAILAAVLVVLLKNREKTASVIREYESEAKRITWLSWKDTKKSSIVVIIGLVVCATIICFLDLGLSNGFFAFVVELFAKIAK